MICTSSGGFDRERMRITFDGKIGINGTAGSLTAPTYQLDLGGRNNSENTTEQNTIRIRNNNNGTSIRVGSGGGSSKINILRIDGASGGACFGETDKSAFGVTLVYHGERSGVNNSFAIHTDNQQAANQLEAFNLKQDGSYAFAGGNSSDRDLKENIEPVTETALDKVIQLEPCTWNWKPEFMNVPVEKRFTGFIAQEVQPHIPSIVTGTDGEEDMSIDTPGLLAYTIKALTELNAKCEALQERINILENQ